MSWYSLGTATVGMRGRGDDNGMAETMGETRPGGGKKKKSRNVWGLPSNLGFGCMVLFQEQPLFTAP